MKHFFATWFFWFLLFNLAAGFYIAYQQQQLLSVQTKLNSLTVSNKKLAADYANYKKKVKNLRQIVITTDDTTSQTSKIGDLISKYTSQVDGSISVYYKNLISGDQISLDGEHEYYMASLYKVIVTLYVLQQSKAGLLSLNDLIGSPPITLNQALNKIITESNNEYAQAIANKYGWSNIEQNIKQRLSVDFTFDQSLQTNVLNMGAIFEDIAKALNVTDDESRYLLQLLNQQQRTNKLPKYLPGNIFGGNKTGEFNDYSHDAAIFYTPKANYILIFMSQTPSPGDTNEKMALMSKDIYDTLNQ